MFELLTKGLECCSDTAISFHYVTPNQMYVIDYLVYHLRPYGISPHFHPPDEKANVSTTTLPPSINATTVVTKGNSSASNQEAKSDKPK